MNHMLVLINDLVVTVWHAGHVGLSDHLHLAHMPRGLWVAQEQTKTERAANADSFIIFVYSYSLLQTDF